MIPYIQIPPIRVGESLVLQPFGLLVAVGCVAGALVARREARLRGLDVRGIDGCLFWALVPGFFLSRLVELVFYHPETLVERPWALLNFWGSMSSFGGFIGGALGVVGYFAFTRKPIMPYCECLVVGLVVGWFFGRLGCTIVHDHPGVHTDFPLAVMFPDGPRHDLGLYEWIFTIGLMIVVFLLPRRDLPVGSLLGGVCVAYAPVRFLLDFLRSADVRYFGLTFGQYAAIAMLVAGATLLVRALTRPRVPQGDPNPV